MLTQSKNRGGGRDVYMMVCDGLKGLPESIITTWDPATVQVCIIVLLRNTFRFGGLWGPTQIAEVCPAVALTWVSARNDGHFLFAGARTRVRESGDSMPACPGSACGSASGERQR